MESHEGCRLQGLYLADRRFEHLPHLFVSTLSLPFLAFLHLPLVHASATFSCHVRQTTRATVFASSSPPPPSHPTSTDTTDRLVTRFAPPQPRPVATYRNCTPSSLGWTGPGQKGGIRGDAEGGIGAFGNQKKARSSFLVDDVRWSRGACGRVAKDAGETAWQMGVEGELEADRSAGERNPQRISVVSIPPKQWKPGATGTRHRRAHHREQRDIGGGKEQESTNRFRICLLLRVGRDGADEQTRPLLLRLSRT